MKPFGTRTGPKLRVERDPTFVEIAESLAKMPAQAPRPREARRRALVVEADPGTRKVCQGVLERFGMVADMVENGVAAVSRARRKPPDVIIVDMQLRDSPGLEVIQWLRSNPALRSTPVIVLTTNVRDVSHSKSWSVDTVLLKPISSEAMESTVRVVMNPGSV